MKNSSTIFKEPYDVPKSDIIGMIYLDDDSGYYKDGIASFNHIIYNGKLITDVEEINKLL